MADDNERERLLAERERLRQRLDAIRRDFARGLDADAEEQAVELENAEVLNEIARVTAEELERVQQRLARLGRR